MTGHWIAQFATRTSPLTDTKTLDRPISGKGSLGEATAWAVMPLAVAVEPFRTPKLSQEPSDATVPEKASKVSVSSPLPPSSPRSTAGGSSLSASFLVPGGAQDDTRSCRVFVPPHPVPLPQGGEGTFEDPIKISTSIRASMRGFFW